MEIKLTADWIFLHNSELFISSEGEACFRIFDGGFQYHLIELALKTLNVKYECEELFDEEDEDQEKPTYYYTIDNIEDIKDTCPELYKEFQKCIQEKIKWKDDNNKKRNIVITFLDTPKTQSQIHKHLETEFYKKEDDYEKMKSWLKNHTDSLIKDLLRSDLISKKSNKYTLL